MGVGKPPEKMETDAYVLQNFSSEESGKLSEVINEAVEAIIDWLNSKVKN